MSAAWWFLAGTGVGILMMGIVHLAESWRWHAKDRELREHFLSKLDEIGEWSQRSLDQNRRDLGLPPRQVT